MGNTLLYRGQHVALGLLKRTDAALIKLWMNNPEVMEGLAQALSMSAQAADYLVVTSLAANKNIGFGIHELKSGTLVGFTVIYDINWQRRTGTTGTIIGEAAYRGKGYGTEAKQLLLDYAFLTLDLFALLSRVPAYNQAAASHLKKCGYKEVARIPNWLRRRDGGRADEILFLVTQQDWLSRDKGEPTPGAEPTKGRRGSRPRGARGE